jgi:hypothetical protein
MFFEHEFAHSTRLGELTPNLQLFLHTTWTKLLLEDRKKLEFCNKLWSNLFVCCARQLLNLIYVLSSSRVIELYIVLIMKKFFLLLTPKIWLGYLTYINTEISTLISFVIIRFVETSNILSSGSGPLRNNPWRNADLSWAVQRQSNPGSIAMFPQRCWSLLVDE